MLYHRWKKLKSDSQTSWIEITNIYYASDYPIRWLIEEGWTRIEPGKTFKEIK